VKQKLEFNLFRPSTAEERASSLFSITVLVACISVMVFLGLISSRNGFILSKRTGGILFVCYVAVIPVCVLLFVLL